MLAACGCDDKLADGFKAPLSPTWPPGSRLVAAPVEIDQRPQRNPLADVGAF